MAGGGNLTLASNEAGDQPTINVLQGTHQFQAEVNLSNETTVDVAAGSTLIFNNALNLNGNILTKSGDGTMLINNKLNTDGGMIFVTGGILGGDGEAGGDVVNSGGTVSPGSSNSGSASNDSVIVPEPATITLGIVTLVMLFVSRTSHRRRNQF